tara:strand:+ start:786 stop:989 length:204 start_codon:yes stop_codon:yes gene_type:complete
MGDIFWLDNWDGKAKGGFYYRSKIAFEVNEIETSLNQKVVGIRLEKDENDKPSWTVEFITEISDENT